MLRLTRYRQPSLDNVNKKYYEAIICAHDILMSICQCFGVNYVATYIRGSTVYGNDGPHSDIDILFLVRYINEPVDLQQVKQATRHLLNINNWPFHIGIKVVALGDDNLLQPPNDIDTDFKAAYKRHINLDFAINAASFHGEYIEQDSTNIYNDIEQIKHDSQLFWGEEVVEALQCLHPYSSFEDYYHLIKRLLRLAANLMLENQHLIIYTQWQDCLACAIKHYPLLKDELNDVGTFLENCYREYHDKCEYPSLFFSVHKLAEYLLLEERYKSVKLSIRPVGRLWQVNSNNEIANDAAAQNVTAPWNSCLPEVIAIYQNYFGESLHSIYLRGSIARGLAIELQADFDTVCVIKPGTHTIAIEKLAEAGVNLKKQFPFVYDFDFYVITFDELFNESNHQSQSEQFILSTQSVCIYGDDLTSQIKPFKINEDLLNILEIDIGAAYQQAMQAITKDISCDDKKSWCRWLMKLIIRCGYQQVMLDIGAYTRDLYLCYLYFSRYHPQYATLMYDALCFAVRPSADIKQIDATARCLVKYLQYQ